MLVMLCNHKSKFFFRCVLIASRIHTVRICDAMTSAEKWFRPVTSDDCKELEIHRGTPRKGIGRDGVVSSSSGHMLGRADDAQRGGGEQHLELANHQARGEHVRYLQSRKLYYTWATALQPAPAGCWLLDLHLREASGQGYRPGSHTALVSWTSHTNMSSLKISYHWW